MCRPVAGLLLLLLPGLIPPAFGAEEVFRLDKARFESFSREVPEGGSITFRVDLGSGFHSPLLVRTQPNGETAYLRPTRSISARRHEFDVLFGEGAGAYRMELVVDSSGGDTSAAQFTIYAGVPRPPEGEPGETRRPEEDYAPERPDESAVRLERRLFSMINAYRKSRGLRPFPWLEEAAQLGREHLADYLKLKPRPDRFLHVLPGHGAIADRFHDVLAWPRTVRKFPVRDPEIGPEATSYCSESLAAPLSLDWLFREYFLRESAFRAPIISEYPSHAAVAIVREGGTNRLFTASICLQLNSTRVREELARAARDAAKLESGAREAEDRARFLRRLGRLSRGEDGRLFRRRLRSREPVVKAAALDALFLNEPEEAEEWVDEQTVRLVRAQRDERYGTVVPILQTFAAVEYDAATRNRGKSELAALSKLARTVMDRARELAAAGDLEFARESLALLLDRFEGLPEAGEAGRMLEELASGAPEKD